MPRIQTTPMVRVALIALRVYLVVMLALILVKFLRIFDAASAKGNAPKPAAAQPQEGSKPPAATGLPGERREGK